MKKLMILLLMLALMTSAAAAEDVVILGGEGSRQEIAVGETVAPSEEMEFAVDRFVHSAPKGNYTHQDVTVVLSLQSWAFDTFDAVEITDFEVRYGQLRYPARCLSGEHVPVEMLMNRSVVYTVRVPNALLYAQEAETAQFVLTVDGLEYVLTAAQCASLEGQKAAASNAFFALVKPDGTLWTWGYNGNGQLGDGTTTDRDTPQQVLDQVVSVWAGCYHMMALREDGTLWTWGNNGNGQLGDGTTNHCITPRQVLDGVVDAAAGFYHSVALREDGSVWTWGDNGSGQLGDGTTNDCGTPRQVMEGAAAVAASAFTTGVLSQDGALWAAGAENGRSRFERVNAGVWSDGNVYLDAAGTLYRLGGQKIKEGVAGAAAFDAGNGFNVLMADEEGRLWAYGREDCGELGNGGAGDETLNTPEVILENVKFFDLHYASIAITADGSVYTWGYKNSAEPALQSIRFE